jgi:hypothetical protein
LNVELGIIADLLLQTPTLGSRQNYYIVLQQVDDIERVFSQSYFSFFCALLSHDKSGQNNKQSPSNRFFLYATDKN